MAHLIAGDGQEPQVRVSWDAPAQQNGGQPHGQPERWCRALLSPSGATTYSDRAIVPGTSLLVHRDSRERGGLEPGVGSGDGPDPAGPIGARQPRRHPSRNPKPPTKPPPSP